MDEKNYIRYRKLKAFCNSLCFYLCRIFPIQKNLISVCTFEGKGGFGCNPKYIIQELHKNNPNYEFVWFVNDMTKEFPNYVRKVPNTLWNRAYWLSRSKVWIDNYRKPLGTKKRKGQYYLNTWHGSIYIKPIGLWRKEAFSKMAYLVSYNDSSLIDGMLIDSTWCKEAAKKGFVFEGTCLKTGMPRCDILFGDKTKQKIWVHQFYKLPQDVHIAMFAPTFRESAVDGKRNVHAEIGNIDLKSTIDALEKRFGGVWYICLRLHPQLIPVYQTEKAMEIENRILDGNVFDDMYELLAGMDAYITDYSSAAFEAAYSNIPVFIYANDICQYEKSRGQLMWNIANPNDDRSTIVPNVDAVFPFGIATNNDELKDNIMSYDEKKYHKTIEKFCKNIKLCFDGKASGRVAYILEKELSWSSNKC